MISLIARRIWIEKQVLEVSRECEVTLAEARTSRSSDQWDREWMLYVARHGDPAAPVEVKRSIWNTLVLVCGSYSEACRWARLHGIKAQSLPLEERALLWFNENPDKDSEALAKALGITPTAASNVCCKLVRKGLITFSK